MTEHRKLAAVMFTDIIGYTSLMSRDEKAALTLLQKNRDLQKSLAEKHHGEFLKEMGDGTLLCFQSALDAVRCAMEIQKSVQDDPDLNLRIGIHLGDIVFKDGDVFGDGVNVASRIEALAEAGGICISEQIHLLIRNKPEINAVYLGEKTLKNVDHPVKIFELARKGEKSSQTGFRIQKEIESKEKSIVVLPFENMSPDPEQEYFSDGLTEEIITDLSHIHELLVISRSSAMTFKGTNKKIKEIAREVNVQYVLEGSVRKAGNNLRITAQLIDATTDAHLWAEKYSGTLDDVFDIQEKVSRSIVDALKMKLSPKEDEQIAERQIDNVQAYEFYFKAIAEIHKYDQKSISLGQRYLQNALDITGDNARLYSTMGWSYQSLADINVNQEVNASQAESYIKKALIRDSDFPGAHAVQGWISWGFKGNPGEAFDHFRRSLEINPNETVALLGSAAVAAMIGKNKEAIHFNERLLKLDPLDFLTICLKGFIPFWDGNYEGAHKSWKKMIRIFPNYPVAQFFYAMNLVYLDETLEAVSIIERGLKENPDHGYLKLGLFITYAMAGDKNKALQMIAPGSDFLRDCQRIGDMSAIVAFFLSSLDAKEDAMDWLEHAIKLGFINYPYLAEKDPFLENIRGEEQFKKLMESVKHEWENFEV